MSSSKPTRLVVNAPNELADIEVVNANFERAATGLGSIEADVNPGVYRVHVRFGSETRQSLVTVEEGQTNVATIEPFTFQSAAPGSGTRGESKLHQQGAFAATKASPVRAEEGRLVLFLRNLGPDADKLSTASIGALSLLDESFAPTLSERTAFDADPAGSCASMSIPLKPGGYAIRFHPRNRDVPIDQSVWVSKGWTTLVFIPTRHSRSAEAWVPAPDLASIHILKTDHMRHPDDMSKESLVLETALADLRRGRRLKSSKLEDQLLNAKFANPMLGIVGAHGLLLSLDVDVKRLHQIVENLHGLLPEHPDVSALAWMLMMRGGEASSATKPLRWPPMMAAGFRGVIEADRQFPNVLVPESAAERAAINMVSGGTWSMWQVEKSAARAQAQNLAPMASAGVADAAAETVLDKIAPALMQGADMSDEMRALKRNTTFTDALETLARSLSGTAAFADAIASVRSPDPATERLRQFISEMLSLSPDQPFDEFVEKLDAQTISRSTGLPMRPVQQLLRTVKSAIEAAKTH